MEPVALLDQDWGLLLLLPSKLAACTHASQAVGGASLSVGHSLLSNLSARRERMVTPEPSSGSWRPVESCLMGVNTNCSGGAGERPPQERTTHMRQEVSRTAIQHTHTHVNKLQSSFFVSASMCVAKQMSGNYTIDSECKCSITGFGT